MRPQKHAVLLSLAIATTAIACHDVEAPLGHAVPVPVPVLRSSASGPDSTFSIPAERGFPPTKNYLLYFPWDTWVTLESPGTVYLNAKDKLPNASPNYIWPSRPVGATGQIDNHTDGVCALGLSLSDNYGPLPSFGICGATPKIDTLLSRKIQTPWVIRGPLPVKHWYECSNVTDVCHWLNSGDLSTVRERAIPVTLKKLKASKQVSTFVSTTDSITFTASKTPDSLYIGGGAVLHPIAITFWQWIGADSTRNPTQPWTAPCHSNATLFCRYAPQESGRMVVKAFTGGYEQSSSVTVQCIIGPNDPMLNDSTGDFSLRDALRDALVRANPDSLPGAGANALHAGYRRETGGLIWQLADGSYKAVPVDDFSATECHYTPDAGMGSPPETGAHVVAIYHTHPSNQGDDIYGCDKSTNGVGTRSYPGGPGVLPTMEDPKATGGGSGWKKNDKRGDWPQADQSGAPVFILQKDGTAWRLDPDFVGDKKTNPNHWSAFGNAYDPNHLAGKCSWPKKYYYPG
jgi:hypothetical protein